MENQSKKSNSRNQIVKRKSKDLDKTDLISFNLRGTIIQCEVASLKQIPKSSVFVSKLASR